MWWVITWALSGLGFCFGYAIARSGMGRANDEWEREDRDGFWMSVGFLLALGKIEIVQMPGKGDAWHRLLIRRIIR